MQYKLETYEALTLQIEGVSDSMSVSDTNTILSHVVSSEYLQSLLFSQIIASVPVVFGVYVLDKLETMNSSVLPI